MQARNLRNLLIATGLVLSLAAIGLFAWRSQHLKSQAARVAAGMSRVEVEAILGPPYMELDRVAGAGTLAVWIDDFWQLDVHFDPEGRVELVTCVPSDSFYRRSVNWLKSWTE
ncbi:MAG: hypothetical protein JNG89_00375 [Planctomycetaceae bacterium]|nr:hypothetical protein [Planctomycetaceae bacterium]